ncbi:MAG: Zn-dependent hydrolase, partial [Bacteroidales bacterium]|nr:Zn-dependent hydrolase [Bacteroidales bacterium]
MKKSTLIMMICLMTVALLTSACKSKKQSEIATEPEKSEMQRNVEEFAYFDLKSDLVAGLSDNDKKLLSIFIDIADIMDDLFWKQTFGDKNILDTISDPYTKDYAMIHYGPWDRLREDKPFVAGYGERPLGACYYPQDITKEEFDAFQDKDKNSLYTVIRRNEDGS